MKLSFTVPGKPVPQGAIKTFLAGGRARGRHSNAAELQDYRARVAMVAARLLQDRAPTDAPVIVSVRFYITRPKSHFGSGRNADKLRGSAPARPVTRPDLSHFVRALEDGLTGVVIRDDSQIIELDARKFYGHPRTEVSVVSVPATCAEIGLEREEAS